MTLRLLSLCGVGGIDGDAIAIALFKENEGTDDIRKCIIIFLKYNVFIIINIYVRSFVSGFSPFYFSELSFLYIQ